MKQNIREIERKNKRPKFVNYKMGAECFSFVLPGASTWNLLVGCGSSFLSLLGLYRKSIINYIF